MYINIVSETVFPIYNLSDNYEFNNMNLDYYNLKFIMIVDFDTKMAIASEVEFALFSFLNCNFGINCMNTSIIHED